MPAVFISYSRHDKGFVQRLHDALAAREYDVWVDWEDIPPSAEWFEEIRAGVRSADGFIYVISPDSVASEVCSRELGNAVDQHKRIVPVVCREPDDTQVPELAAALNWVFLREDDDFDAGVQALIAAVETDLEHVRTHTRLGVAAARWEASGHDRSQLLRGSDLTAAEAWLIGSAGKEPQPSQLQREYVHASRQAASLRQRVTIGAVSLALAVAIALAVVALIQRSSAITAKNAALSRELALNSISNLDIDPQLSLLLAIRAARTSHTAEARDALASALAESQIRSVLRVGTTVRSAEFSPDDRTLVVGADDGSARVWSPASGKQLILHTPATTLEAAFGTEGASVLTASNDGYVRRFGAGSGKSTAQAGPLPFATEYYRFSPDRQLLVLCGFAGDRRTTGAVWVWHLSSGHIIRLRGLSDPNDAVAVSSDDRLIAAITADRAIGLWDATTGRRVGHTFGGPSTPSYSVAFSPKGDVLAGGGGDAALRVWNVRTGAPSGPTMRGHTGVIYSVAFSPDGKSIVSGGNDSTVRLWDTASGSQLDVLRGQTGGVLTAAFSADGSQIVTGGDDGIVRVWDIGTGLPVSAPAALYGEALSADGQWALVRTATGALDVLQLAGKRPPVALRGNPGSLLGATFSRNDKYAATVGADGTVRVWATASGRPVGTPVGHLGYILGADLSTDGSALVISNVLGDAFSSTVRVWNVDTGTLIGHRLVGHEGWVTDVAFSPNGRSVLTGGNDRTARIWDVATDQQSVPAMMGHTGPLYAVAWSPDGRTVITTSDDQTARIWNARTGALLHSLRGHTAPVRETAYSPDSRSVLTVGDDRSIRIWDVATGTPAGILHGTTSTTLAGFGPDSRSVFTFSPTGAVRVAPCAQCGDSLARLLSLARARVTRGFTPQERAQYLH